jgi:hypothetical protein
MAPIGLPQESSHPSYWTIDLYATSLSFRFVSGQECAVTRKMTKQGRFGLGATDVPAVWGAAGCVAGGRRDVCRSEQQKSQL